MKIFKENLFINIFCAIIVCLLCYSILFFLIEYSKTNSVKLVPKNAGGWQGQNPVSIKRYKEDFENGFMTLVVTCKNEKSIWIYCHSHASPVLLWKGPIDEPVQNEPVSVP